MKQRSVCTNQYRPTVHLYLYVYLHLYVQCNAVAVTVAPLRKKEVGVVFLTRMATHPANLLHVAVRLFHLDVVETEEGCFRCRNRLINFQLHLLNDSLHVEGVVLIRI